MFNPIITDNPTPEIIEYNRLIANKPKTGTLAEKIEAQRAWKNKVHELLNKFFEDTACYGEATIIIPNIDGEIK